MPAGTSPLPSGPVPAAKLIVAYHRVHGVLPTVAGAPGSDEAELYRALRRLRLLHGQGKLERKAVEVLDKRIPGWEDGYGYNSERLWRQRRDELIRWMKKAKRLPHPGSGDEVERALAAWISAYRKHVRHGRHADRIRELDTKIPGWNESRKGTP
ncbi:hypothetical protein J2T11_003227 [Paenarthrobacter nicotinovorans]|uniref:hypothetical protein n=1 Tax=Paenarthrobacter nicotinovorans TaxID=29320 RepID=UPI00278604F4|nr:hypothetical protein [Paenarthrobacter nicotinovorans]MDP9936859.1 hypothetical protein [Paenarthrobacter nicotinovorans]